MSDWEKVTSSNDGWEKVPSAGTDGWEKVDEKKGAFEAPKRKTTVAEDFYLGVANSMNTLDSAWSGVGMGMQSLLGDYDSGDKIYQNLQKRKKNRLKTANPEEADQSFGGKVLSAASTLPLQIPAMLMSPSETGQTFLDQGETLGKAGLAAGIDAAGNLAGVAMPIAKSLGKNVLLNAAQDTATRAAISGIADKDTTKEIFNPTWETAGLAGVIGGGVGAVKNMSGKKKSSKRNDVILDKLKAAKEQEKTQTQVPTLNEPEQGMLFDFNADPTQGLHNQFNAGRGFDDWAVDENGIPVRQQLSNDVLGSQDFTQKSLFEDPQSGDNLFGLAAEDTRQAQVNERNNFFEQAKQDAIVEDYGNNDPMDRMPNMRIDENGMPIRADLSMEAQNLENPLQRNLWGDELGPALDQTRSLTEAIDATPKGPMRDAQMEQLTGQAKPRGQRGVLNMGAIMDAYRSLNDTPDGWKKLFRSFTGTFNPTELEAANRSLQNPNSMDTIVFMSPNDFHKMAMERPKGYESYGDQKRSNVRKGLQKEEGLDDIPYLRGAIKDGQFKVESHNGRHRMDVFKEQGLPLVPVRLKAIPVDNYFNGWGTDGVPRIIKGENGVSMRMPTNLTNKDGTGLPTTSKPLSLVPKSQRGAIDFSFEDKRNKQLVDEENQWVKQFRAEQQQKRVQNQAEKLTTISQDFQKNSNLISKAYKLDSMGLLLNDPELDIGHYVRRLKEGHDYMIKASQALSEQNFDLFERHAGNTDYVMNSIADYPEKLQRYIDAASQERNRLSRKRHRYAKETVQEIDSILNNVIKIPRNQRGALDFGTIPDNPDPTKVVAEALKEGTDGSRVMKNVESGSSLAAARRKSAAVRGGGQILQNADKRADLNIRRHVFPTEQSLRRFSDDDFTLGWDILKTEMLQRSRFTGEQLEAAGLTEHQLEAYVNLRKMHEEAIDAINDARLTQGLDPVTPQEYYVSSRWSGDFRRPVYKVEVDPTTGEAKEKLVWYLAANTKWGLNKQAKALQEAHPDLVIDSSKDKHVRSPGVNEIKLDYTTMLDIVGRDDPAAEKIQKWFENEEVETGQKAYAQEKHFEKKGNTRGFVGDRPGVDPVKDAKAAYAQQIQYAKNAFKWAEIQKAAEDLKKITNDPDLVKQQPNNVQYLKDLFKNYAGMNEARFVRNLEDGMRDTLGVSPRVVNEALGGVKSFFILQKLGVSAGYTLASALQYLTVFPHMIDMQAKGLTTRNPAASLTSSILGLMTGMATAASHYGNKAGMDTMSMIKSLPDGDFLSKAYQYAEDNGITARSIYDESPIHTQGSKVAQAGELIGKTLTVPETVVRASAFMSYVYLLRQGDAFNGDTPGLLQKAEELTNISMVDYRAGERPMMFSKLGMAGNLMNTLQTFPMNFYNQWMYFGKEAMSGNPAPLLAAMAVQMGVAGMMGLPGFQDLDWLWEQIKPMLSDKMFAKTKNFDPKLFVLENMDDAGLYGQFAEATDLGITSRVSAPAIVEMPSSPFGMIGDLAGQVGKVGSLAMDPSNKTKQAQAGMAVAPVGLQGLLETTAFRDQTSAQGQNGNRTYFNSSDLGDRSAAYSRTPEQERVRKILGLKTLDEVKSREVDYRLKKNERDIMDRSRSITEKYYDAVRSGNQERATELYNLYLDLNGKAIDKTQIERQLKEEFMTESQRKAAKGKNMSPQELINLKRSQNILKEQ